MLAYLLRRLGYLVFVVWGVGFAAFFISRIVPADPAAAALGANAREEQIEAYREQFGLNDPVPVQYVNYMQDLFRGDLGESLRTRRPIIEDLKDYFPATLELTLAAMLIALLVGIPAGIIAALYQNRPVDLIVRTLALLGGATPVYWLAIVMLNVFHAQLGVLPGPGRLNAYLFPPDPVTGMLGVDALLARDYEVFWDGLRHLILPAVVLGAFSTALLARMVRSAMLETLSQDYIRTARAKGLSEGRVLGHALRNALVPVLALFGLDFGALVGGGTVLVEVAFGLRGVGKLTADALQSLDLAMVMAAVLYAAVFVVLSSAAVDALQAALDPRQR